MVTKSICSFKTTYSTTTNNYILFYNILSKTFTLQAGDSKFYPWVQSIKWFEGWFRHLQCCIWIHLFVFVAIVVSLSVDVPHLRGKGKANLKTEKNSYMYWQRVWDDSAMVNFQQILGCSFISLYIQSLFIYFFFIHLSFLYAIHSYAGLISLFTYLLFIYLSTYLLISICPLID